MTLCNPINKVICSQHYKNHEKLEDDNHMRIMQTHYVGVEMYVQPVLRHQMRDNCGKYT